MKYIIIILCLISNIDSYCQLPIEWSTNINGTEVYTIANDSFLFSIHDFNPSSQKPLIYCYGSSGTIKWVDTVISHTSHQFKMYGTNTDLYMVCNLGTKIMTYKINISTGAILWTEFESVHYMNNTVGITIDSANNVYVLCKGNFGSSSQADRSVLIKYDGISGNKIWEKEFYNSHEEDPQGIKFYNGSLYVYGRTQPSLSVTSAIVQKYDTSGNIIYNSLTNIDNALVVVNDIIFDNMGHIYIGGVQETISTPKSFISKIDEPTGTVIWTEKIGGINATQDTIVVGTIPYLAYFNSEYTNFFLRNDGNIQFTGTAYLRPHPYSSPVDTSVMLICYSPSGNKVIRSIDNYTDPVFVRDVFYKNEIIYSTSAQQISSNKYDILISVYDSSLQLIDTTNYSISKPYRKTSVTHNDNNLFISDTYIDTSSVQKILDLAYGYKTYCAGIDANYSYIHNGGGNYTFNNTSTGNFNQTHWAFGDGNTSTLPNPNHTFSANGTYVVVLTTNDSTSSSCMDYFLDTIIVTGVASPLQCVAGFVMYPDTTINNVIVVNSSTGTNLTYLWDFGDGDTSSLQFPSHTYATSGPYYLCLTINDGGSCVDMYCDSIGENGVVFSKQTGFTINVIAPPLTTQVNEHATLNSNVAIYPNPNNGSFEMVLDIPFQQAKLTILDLTGKVIIQQKITQNNTQLNLLSHPKGMYFYQLLIDGKQVTEKLIVQ